MSRCYPYPPPGYTLSRAINNDALIESIKLQKEKKVSREHKKERSNEKKEKKEKRKEKRKDEKDQNKKLRKSENSKSQSLGKFPYSIGEPMLKGKEFETEQVERSDLTQEHGLPVRLDVLPTSSSESTDTSNKRKRISSPLNDIRAHGTGNILRIKLAPKKQKTDMNAPVNELRVILKSDITSLAANDKESKTDSRHICESSHVATRTNVDQICSMPCPAESLANGQSQIPSLPNAVMTSMGEKERKYNKLFLNWSLPLPQPNLDVDDLDWLSEKPKVSAGNTLKTQSSGVLCLSSSALMQPCAQLLNEVNIYALPFTVPF